MKRLTKRSDKTSHENGVCCTHFMSKECHDVAGNCAYGCKWEESAWSKLADFEDAEEKGLLFKMPCKPGETVFVVISKTREIKEHKVSKIILGKQHDQIVFNGQTCFTIWGKNWDEYFYKYVHFTREAAEQALQQIKEET